MNTWRSPAQKTRSFRFDVHAYLATASVALTFATSACRPFSPNASPVKQSGPGANPSLGSDPSPGSASFPTFELAATGHCAMDVTSIPGMTFLRIAAPERRQTDPHRRSTISTGSREKLLRLDRTGVHAEAALSRGLPEESGWIMGTVSVEGHWPGAPRLSLELTSPSHGGQAALDSTVSRYLWGSAGWVPGPPGQFPPPLNQGNLCGDPKTYNGLVREYRVELPTGDRFVIGNCQWLGRMAPTRPPRAVIAAQKDGQSAPRIWVLPETDALDPYMVARLELVSPTEGYVSVSDAQAYLAKFSGTQIERIAVPFDGPVTSLAARGDGTLWIAAAGRLAFRATTGNWSELPLPHPEAGDKADQVGRLEGNGLWLKTTSSSGEQQLFMTGHVENVYQCP